LACAIGCATESQGDGLPGPGGGDSGSGNTTAGSGGGSSDGGSAGMNATAGSATAGSTTGGAAPQAGSSNGGSFSVAGFQNGGTFSTSGTGGSAPAGGSGGSAGAAGAGGKGGSGGTGGSAGAGGKGGSGGSGGSAGAGGTSGATCATGELKVSAATALGTSQYAPANAIDGDVGTRWGSEQMIDDMWLQLDMGEAVTVNRVSIQWEAAYATHYKIEIGDNAAGPFTELYDDPAGAGGTDDVTTPTLKLGRGRYVRMHGLTRKLQAYGYSIFEMKVYGDKDETCK
jgi:hypothetical protein